MRTFACGNCGQLVFFENTECLSCGAALGFEWDSRELRTLLGEFNRCANAEIAACNWLVDAGGELCASCRLTRLRPADDDPAGLEALAAAEQAKRRLLFELAELGLPIVSEGEGALAFDLLSSAVGPVTTGHADGLITLDLAESDDARREARRLELDEPYRTVLGHLRHEIGHYYWPILASDEQRLERARALFGDERDDYAAALERHYQQGPPADWSERFVSAYATMHPSEDWAETFAHYLHIRDTLQTAASYRLQILGPQAVAQAQPERDLAAAPAASGDTTAFHALLGEWLPLTYALNALNRSMGRQDLYPFVLAPPVIEKLSFVHGLCCAHGIDT